MHLRSASSSWSRVVIGLALAGAAMASASAADAPPSEVILAIGDPSLSVATAPYASLQQAVGLDQRFAGVSVKVQPTAGASASAQAVANGNAFYTWGGTPSLVAAAAQDHRLAIIAIDANNPWRIVVPPDSPIKSLADLKGKVVGTPSLGAAAYLYGIAALREAGLHPSDDVTILPVGVGAQAAAALKSGQVQAYAGYDNPNAVIGNLLGVELRVLSSPLDSMKGGAVVVVNRASIEKFPKIVGGLCRAFYASLVFAKANPDATIRTHWQHYPEQRPSNKPEAEALTEAERILKPRVENIAPGAEGLFGNQPVGEIQEVVTEYARTGLLPSAPNLADLVDTRFKQDCGGFDALAIAAEAKAWPGPAPSK
jgi:NitT/TauT family transport system substrate-binding protein